MKLMSIECVYIVTSLLFMRMHVLFISLHIEGLEWILVTNVSISHFVISFLVIHKELLGCKELVFFETTNFTLKLFLHNSTFIQVFPSVLRVKELFTWLRTPVWPDIPMRIQMPLKVSFLEEHIEYLYLYSLCVSSDEMSAGPFS